MPARAIVIGASAGGVHALSPILSALPRDYPLPVLVVVHVPPRRDSALVEVFARKCRVMVKEAEDKEPLVPGTVYFAPPDYHLLVETEDALALSADETVNHSRPAIDVLFETAADVFGPELIGIVLTGANHDGARGLAAVSAGGGLALVQDPASAEVAAMPAAAIAAVPSARVLPLDGIATYLTETAA